MNVSGLVCRNAPLASNKCISDIPMATVPSGTRSALLAKFNHQLKNDFVLTRGKSALFADNRDCFECLSPMPFQDRKARKKYNAA